MGEVVSRRPSLRGGLAVTVQLRCAVNLCTNAQTFLPASVRVLPQVTASARHPFMAYGLMGIGAGLGSQEIRPIPLTQLVWHMMFATLKPGSRRCQISEVRTLNCRPAINNFATQ